MAAPIENPAGLNHHARGMNLTGDYSLGLNLYPALRENHSVKPAGDDYLIALDLAFNLRAFTQDKSLVAEDVAFYLRFDSQCAGKLQRALKADGPIQKAGPLSLRFRWTPLI